MAADLMEGWEVFDLAKVGDGADDGVSLMDEVTDWLKKLQAQVRSESYGNAGSVSIKLTVSKVGAEGSVVITPEVKATPPKKVRKSEIVVCLSDGRMVRESARQMAFEAYQDAAARKRVERSEVQP